MKVLRWGWVCAWLCLCAAVPGRAQSPPPPTTGAYAAALANVQAALVRQSALLHRAAPGARDTVPVEALTHTALDRFTLVAGPSGVVQPVNSLLLEQSLHRVTALPNAKARATAYAQAAAQIGALRAELSGSGAAAAPATAQATLRATLGRAEFDSDPLPPPSLWERFLAWLDRLFSRRHAPSAPSSSISPAFIKALLILVAAGAFALLVAVLVQWLRQRARPAGGLALTEQEEALVEARDADSLRALAEEQARQGQWRRAFRLTYLATLVALDTHGTLRFDRSKTNWEYLRALRAAGQGETYAALLPLTREFDRIWYGGAEADGDDYAYASAQYHALTQRASAPATPAPAAAS